MVAGRFHWWRIGAAVAVAALSAVLITAEIVQSVTSADEICAPEDDPCIIDTQIEVGDDDNRNVVLDFGTRAVRIEQGGMLDVGDRLMRIYCGDFTIDVGDSLAIDARQSGEGGRVVVEANRRCSERSDRLCRRDDTCNLGGCSAKVCASATAERCDSDDECSFGTCGTFCEQGGACVIDEDCNDGPCDLATRTCVGDRSRTCFNNIQCSAGACLTDQPRCSGNTAVTCSVDADCSTGPCDVDVCERRDEDGDRLCTSAADCSDGACSDGSGTITLNGRIRAAASFPGDVSFYAAGDVAVEQTIDVVGSHGDADGGSICFDSGEGNVAINAVLKANGGGRSSGGEIDITAGGDVHVAANILSDGGEGSGGLIAIGGGGDIVVDAEIDARSRTGGGCGGEIFLEAGRDIRLDPAANLNTDGSAHAETPGFESGSGGAQDFIAGRDIFMAEDALIHGHGEHAFGEGAFLYFEAVDDVEISGAIRVNGLGAFGTGGDLEIIAGGSVFIARTSRIGIAGGAQSGGGGVDIESVGDVSIVGNIDMGSGEESGDGIFVESGGNLRISGELKLSDDDGVEMKACDVTLSPGARIDATEGFHVFTARERFTLEDGASVTAPGETGTIRILYRDEAVPPVLLGTADPDPELSVLDGLEACGECGNGQIEPGESCDDGNRIDDDGCSGECQLDACIRATPDYPFAHLCDDRDGCTIDVCEVDEGGCVHFESCDDGIECTIDSCDEDSRRCIHEGNDSSCEDDGNPCTATICFSGSGCGPSALDGPACDDGLTCTIGDRCMEGICRGFDDCLIGEVCSPDDVCVPATTTTAPSTTTTVPATTTTSTVPASTTTSSTSSTSSTISNSTSTTLSSPVCGNGIVEAPETCDDGDTSWEPGRYCFADCRRVDCGDPNGSSSMTASDALFVLRAAVGSAECDPCLCNVNDAGAVTAGDALLLLQRSVGLPGAELRCPALCP